MIKAIKAFFEANLSDSQEDNEHRLKLATAALLIEMMQQDGKTRKEETDALRKLLKTKFRLNDTATNELIELASEQARQSVDFYQFTSLINQHYPPEKKIKIIENLWMIAYSDKQLDPHEEHMVRRIAELLYVSHKDFLKTKHKIQESLVS